MLIIDDFYSGFSELKKYAKGATFENIENPVDGVTYPLICKEIPFNILDRVSSVMGRPALNPAMFMRRSPKGVACPHIFHNDISMGRYSLMLYMDTFEGGTGFASSLVTGEIRPSFDYDYEGDQNNIDAWSLYDVCESVENRACIFDASLFHCALPLGGYGYGVDARTVLTVFFS